MEFITYRCLLNIIFFREFIAFRTFHNLLNDSNLAIHCWLFALERTYKNEQKLPDTLFYQIDGASINACNLSLGLCELMVAKRLTRLLPPPWIICFLLFYVIFYWYILNIGKLWLHVYLSVTHTKTLTQYLQKYGKSVEVDVFLVRSSMCRWFYQQWIREKTLVKLLTFSSILIIKVIFLHTYLTFLKH